MDIRDVLASSAGVMTRVNLTKPQPIAPDIALSRGTVTALADAATANFMSTAPETAPRVTLVAARRMGASANCRRQLPKVPKRGQ